MLVRCQLKYWYPGREFFKCVVDVNSSAVKELYIYYLHRECDCNGQSLRIADKEATSTFKIPFQCIVIPVIPICL